MVQLKQYMPVHVHSAKILHANLLHASKRMCITQTHGICWLCTHSDLKWSHWGF